VLTCSNESNNLTYRIMILSKSTWIAYLLDCVSQSVVANASHWQRCAWRCYYL